MEILLISVGKNSIKWLEPGIEEYQKRLNRYIKFEEKRLPDIKNSKVLTQHQQKDAEGKIIINELSESDFICLLDEKGKEFSSVGLSQWFEKIMASGRKRIVFIVGGPYGFSDELYSRSNFKISLSQMTFTHEMVRLFFTEQLYRVMTILRGEPYHHS